MSPAGIARRELALALVALVAPAFAATSAAAPAETAEALLAGVAPELAPAPGARAAALSPGASAPGLAIALPEGGHPALEATTYTLAVRGMPWGPSPFTARAALLRPTISGLSVEPAFAIAAGRAPRREALLDGALRLRSPAGRAGIWFGGWSRLAGPGDPGDPPVHAEAGGWRSWDRLTLSLGIDQSGQIRRVLRSPGRDGSVIDSAHTAVPRTVADEWLVSRTVARVVGSWQDRRWMADVTGALDMAPGLTTRPWLHARLGLRLAPPLWLMLGGGDEPPNAFGTTTRTHGVNLALLLSGARGGEPGGARPRASFRARRAGAEAMRFDLRWPGARAVEVSGDFTGWEPVAMVRSDAGRWRLDLPVPAGVHRVVLRVDGGAWLPPPGLPVAEDEYQGQVGVLAAE